MTGCNRKNDTNQQMDNPQALKTIKPPVAAINHREIAFNDTVLYDDYFWLRDRENPEVIAYLNAENGYADSVMQPYDQLQEHLFEELKARIKDEDRTVPIEEDNYFYYQKTEKDKQYPIYCRRKGNMNADEEIVLNLNELAEGQPYFSLGSLDVSPDHQMVAYTSDTIGDESYSLYIKNLTTRELIEAPIGDLSYALAWANDNQTLFYTTRDEAYRPYKVFLHKIGSAYLEDKMVYHEEDDRFFLNIQKSRDNQFILINLDSKTTSEVLYLDANNPNNDYKVITARVPDVLYSVYPHTQGFFILTNYEAVGFRLMKAAYNATEINHWQEVLSPEDDITLESVDEFENYLAITKRVRGLRQLEILPLNPGEELHIVSFEDPTYTITKIENPNFKSKSLKFAYTSLVKPKEVIEYDMALKEQTMLKTEEVPGGYDPQNYTSERITATAKDGTEIPISLVYRKGMKKNGENPLYLYGYGSYGYSIEPAFNPNRISLLERGFIFALAHIRGGGDMGKQWYLDGKLLNKKNTFTDFIACAEHLQEEKYTSEQKLVAVGGSAGGLLIGAVANMRPDLFKILVAHVPFVDVINTMADASLPLTITEYEEWGNPNEKVYFDYIYSYSPYENVKAQDYPHMLITAGLNDPRVSYWEPAKWTAKLRSLKTDDNRILLKTNMEAGHAGASGRHNYLKEVAFEYAFIFNILKISDEAQKKATL